MVEELDGDGLGRRKMSMARDEESDGLLRTANPQTASLEHQLRSVRIMSLASVVLGVTSVAVMAAVLLHPASPAQASSNADILGLDALPVSESVRGWYRSYLDSQIRSGESLNSDKVKVLYAGSLVYVSEVRGRRARILRPLEGWMSMQTADGVEILRPDMTYDAGPKKADIEAAFRSPQMRAATQSLQATADKLTKVEQQLLKSLEKLKHVPERVEAKLHEEWPRLIDEAPKTGEHVAKHTVNALRKVVKPEGAQTLVHRAAQNEHVQHIQNAIGSNKFSKLVEKAKHEVNEVHRVQKEAGSFKESLRDDVADLKAV